MNDRRHFCIELKRELVEVDDVNITLIELAIASLLWSLTSPCPLDLVAFEREHEVIEMLCDIACKGNCQIVMQTQARFARFVTGMQSLDGIDFLVCLTFCEQDLDRFDGWCF